MRTSTSASTIHPLDLPEIHECTERTRVSSGANPSAEEADDALEEGSSQVNNVVYSFRLQTTSFDKKSFLTYLKGYMKAVKSKLAADTTVKAYQVYVDTSNHVVTLKGDVNTSLAKERAVQIARNTDGVRDVIDQLRVIDTAATSGRLEDDSVGVRVDDGVKSDVDKAAE